MERIPCKRCNRPLKSRQSRFLQIGWACLSKAIIKTWGKEEVTKLARLKLNYTR